MARLRPTCKTHRHDDILNQQALVTYKNCSYKWAYDCTELYTIQHRTPLIIFPLLFQTVISSQMLSIGGEGECNIGDAICHLTHFAGYIQPFVHILMCICLCSLRVTIRNFQISCVQHSPTCKVSCIPTQRWSTTRSIPVRSRSYVVTAPWSRSCFPFRRFVST